MIMYNEFNSNTTPRPAGALDITRRARQEEKAIARLVAEMEVEKSPRANRRPNFFKGVLTALLTSLR
jgi:hypothetical protein